MLQDLLNQASEYISLPMLLVLIPVGYFIVNEFNRWNAMRGLKDWAGPFNWPFVGHLPYIRLLNAPELYRRWSEDYGPVFKMQLGNIPVLCVNNAEYANKVFISNSHATIDRPMFYTFHKVVSSTAGFTIGTSPYNESLKRRRKSAASALNKPAVQTYIPLIDKEVTEFIREVWKSGNEPVNPVPLAQRLSLNLGLTLNWGTRLELDDPMFKEIIDVEELVSRTRSTTGNLQDYIPLFRWFSFGQTSAAVDMRKRRDGYLNKLNKELDDKMAKNEHKPCIQANVLLDPEAKLNAVELMSISLTMIAGGLDTITGLVQWALPVLAKRPDVQEKMYQEIRKQTDEIFPDPIEDQQCKYVVAVIKECLRLYPPVRLSLPKQALEDFYVEGKRVPKGTPIFLNSYGCNQDPKVFPNPKEFNPERFVEKPHTIQYAYGNGTRLCVGYMLANRELYVLFMRLISCFEILPVDDIDLDPVTGTYDPTTLIAQTHPYKVQFRPRDPERIKKALDEFVPVTV